MLKRGIFIMLGTLLLAMPMAAQNVVETDSTGFPQIDTTQIDPLDSIAPASPKKQGLDARVEYTSTDSMVMTGKVLHTCMVMAS